MIRQYHLFDKKLQIILLSFRYNFKQFGMNPLQL